MTQVRGAAETPDRRIVRARVLKGKVKLAQPQHRRGIALLDRSNQHLFGAADIARNIFAVGIAFSDEDENIRRRRTAPDGAICPEECLYCVLVDADATIICQRHLRSEEHTSELQ